LVFWIIFTLKSQFYFMEKIKKIELINYDGHSVETLKFNPPLIIFSDEIQVEDFSTQSELEKNGNTSVSIQFETESNSFEIYDVDIRTNQLLDCIKYAVDDDSKINLQKLEEKIYNAFYSIMQPEGDNRFSEFEGEDEY